MSFTSAPTNLSIRSLSPLFQVRTTSVQETCKGGQILDRTTIHSGGLDITHITQSCPGLAKKARSIPNDTVERRQSNIVNVCTPTCQYSVDQFPVYKVDVF